MNKIKQFINAHYIAIIVTFVVIVMLQQCKSCVNSSRVKFEQSTYASQIDSISNINASLRDSINTLNESLNVANTKIDAFERQTQIQNDVIDALRVDKRDLRNDLRDERNKNIATQ